MVAFSKPKKGIPARLAHEPQRASFDGIFRPGGGRSGCPHIYKEGRGTKR
jgi:hypothetical protein